MILCWWSTRRSGCAASIPNNASATTFCGSLMSFFMIRSPGSRMASGVDGLGREFGIGEIDPVGRGGGAVGGRSRQHAVDKGGRDSGKQFGGQVDGKLVP